MQSPNIEYICNNRGKVEGVHFATQTMDREGLRAPEKECIIAVIALRGTFDLEIEAQ